LALREILTLAPLASEFKRLAAKKTGRARWLSLSPHPKTWESEEFTARQDRYPRETRQSF